MPSRAAMAPKGTISRAGASAPRKPLLRSLFVVRSASTKSTSSSRSLGQSSSHLQASSAASFVARANDEEDEDAAAALMVASEENAKSLSTAAASARAAADARSSPLSATTRQEEAPSSSSATDADKSRKLSPLASLAHAAGVLYRFSRPHTMIGTTISILSVSALALVRLRY